MAYHSSYILIDLIEIVVHTYNITYSIAFYTFHIQINIQNQSSLIITPTLMMFLCRNFSLAMSYLHVAEKNSIAKEVAKILSKGQSRIGDTLSKYNPVYQFSLDSDIHHVSSVRGHILKYDFPPQKKAWKTLQYLNILNQQIKLMRVQQPGVQLLVQNIQSLARKADHLILWLDCDREGQSIAYEVIQIVQKVNPNIKIQRALFSAVTPSDILNAYTNLIPPNKQLSQAVDYRRQIDLRLGAVFTVFQTLDFGKQYFIPMGKLLSYGPCQIPTLGFVVKRYLQIKNFKSQPYWYLSCVYNINEQTKIDLKWMKKNTKDQNQIKSVFAKISPSTKSKSTTIQQRVIQRKDNTVKKYRPYPLITVQFQKLASDKLKMSSAQAMQIAQKLYTSGYISYPRTQTNAFPPTINVEVLVKNLQQSSKYGAYIKKLFTQNKYQIPKTGKKSDQAHVPIHPVKLPGPDLTTNEERVYDLIARSFLACCSKDAIGVQSEIISQVADEKFRASYITIKQMNFLQIFTYQKWSSTALAGEVPDVFNSIIKIQKGKTKPPGYLSQSDLISQMEKNEIGTDSTIHEHIKTIQERQYAVKQQNTFRPTNLGAALIISYMKLGLKLGDSQLRRLMEIRMNQIADGKIARETSVKQTLTMMTPIFQQLSNNSKNWMQYMSEALQEDSSLKKVNIQKKTQVFSHEGGQTKRVYKCYKCGMPGHIAPNCPATSMGMGMGMGNESQTTYSSNKAYKPYQSTTAASGKKVIYKCYKCGQPGHLAPNCPNLLTNQSNQSDQPSTTNTKKVYTCYRCGKEGHIAPNCTNQPATLIFKDKKAQDTQEGTSPDIQKPKKICPQCGVEGRHPKGSPCSQVKRRPKKTIDQPNEGQ